MTTELKDQLLASIRSSHAEMMALIDGFSPRGFELQPNTDAWSARDILAHIAQWESVLLRFHIQGEDFSSVIGLEDIRYRQTPFDLINQHLFEEQRARSASEIKRFANKTHQELMAALRDLPSEALEAPAANLSAQGYAAASLLSYIEAITTEHYDEHLKDLQELADLDR